MNLLATRRVADHEVPNVGAVLADAFSEDPVLSFLFPDADWRPALLGAFFANRLAAGNRIDHILVPATLGEIVATALWEPPRQSDEPEPNFVPTISMFRALLGEDWLHKRLTPLAAIKEARPCTPHWYLGYLGTRQDYRGKGLASALIASVTNHCDAEGLFAYLESSNLENLPLYELHGFRVTGEVAIPQGPVVPLMWRDPQL